MVQKNKIAKYKLQGHDMIEFVWYIIKIKHDSKKLWPGHDFSKNVHCDLDLGDMTLAQGHDTPLIMN